MFAMLLRMWTMNKIKIKLNPSNSLSSSSLYTATALTNSIVSSKLDYCNSLTNQQPRHLYNSLSFRYILFLHDLLIHLFFQFHNFMSDYHLAKGRSLSSVHDSGIHSPWYPKLIFSTNIPFQAQNTPLQNCVPSLGSFPSPLTVYPDCDSCYSHFMPYRMTPSVRQRAIEVIHYYYYFVVGATPQYLTLQLQLPRCSKYKPKLPGHLYRIISDCMVHVVRSSLYYFSSWTRA